MTNNGVIKGQLYIHGIGHFHPENNLDNRFLEDLDIGTSQEWITEHVGIVNRRTVLPLDYIRHTRNSNPLAAREAAEYTNAETGRYAAEMALKKAGLAPQDIGMVIAGGCSPEWSIPAEACAIADLLGIEAPAFDINSACSSMGVQIYNLMSMRPETLPEFILLVHPENNTRVVDYSKRESAVIWGDGTSAVVVSPKIPSHAIITTSMVRSNPGGWKKVMIPREGHFIQDGKAVQKFAIQKTLETLTELRAQTPDGFSGAAKFIGHQANMRMLRSVCKRGAITEDAHYFNVDKFGNTGTAGSATVLSQNWQHFQAGDLLSLVVVGSGLTWAGMLIQFERNGMPACDVA